MNKVVVLLLLNFGSDVRIQWGDGFSLPRVLSTRNVIATKQDP